MPGKNTNGKKHGDSNKMNQSEKPRKITIGQKFGESNKVNQQEIPGKIKIGKKYGDLIKIKDVKKRDHCRVDQRVSKQEKAAPKLSHSPQPQVDSKAPELKLSPQPQVDSKAPELRLSLPIEPRRKKLLILNVNGFLISKVHMFDFFKGIFYTNRPADYLYLNTIYYKRPFSEEFMRFCLQRFEVAIWSSAIIKNVYGALTCAIGGELIDKLHFIWDQCYCTDTEYTSMENAQKPLLMKELLRVWSIYPEYSASNTLMIEDKPYRAIHNPPNTSIFVNSYDLENQMDNFLDPNGELCTYLNEVAAADNVQEYVEHHPFGLPEMTAAHRDWRLYMLLSYSTYGSLVKLRDIHELEEEEDDDEEEEEDDDDDEGSEDALELNLPRGNLNRNVEVQPRRKKLLIMNLNGFLLRRINFADWSYNPSTRIADYIFGNFLHFKRPYSREFMKFCLRRFEVGIWTSIRGYNLNGALTCAIRGLAEKLLFIWDQDTCFNTGYFAMESYGKPLYFKEIEEVWTAEEFGEAYSPANTLVIDDKPYRAVLNPPHTAIFTPSYDLDDEGDNLLDPEGELCNYLNGVAEAEHAGHYVQANPFGLPAITPAHPNWQNYSIFRRVYLGEFHENEFHVNGFHGNGNWNGNENGFHGNVNGNVNGNGNGNGNGFH